MESIYLPLGATHDSSAPYNEVEVPEREFNIKIEYSLSKKTSIESNNYYIDESPDGSYLGTEDIDWQDEYKKQHHTPLDLITLFKQHLEKELETVTLRTRKNELEYLIEECSGWDEDYYDAYEDK